MADEIRQYLRAAQAAELQGEKPEAAEFLCKAAHLYRSSGKFSRALTMLRHALRLDPSRKDLQDEIRRLEWLPDQPMRDALDDEGTLEMQMRRILAPLDEVVEEVAQDSADFAAAILGAPLKTPPAPLPGKPPREIPERAPVLSPIGQEAWCSFCCKPGREVGALVAGATGAFACRNCVRESVRLLGLAGDSAAEPQARSEAERPPEPSAPQTPAAFELPQQAQGRRELQRLLSLGLRRVLLLGAPGAGKTALLNALAASGKGRVLTGATVTAHPPDDALLLIDAVEGLDAAGWTRLGFALERHPGPVVVAMRGTAPATATSLLADDAKLGVPSTSALVEATSGKLPFDFAEQLDSVVVVQAPGEADLAQLARYLLLQRGLAGDPAQALSTALASSARSSERGAHELVALVRRVPKGAWRLDGGPAVTPASRKRKPRKKAEP